MKEKEEQPTKSITRTYRNGNSVFQLDLIIRIQPDKAGKKYSVTEQRKEFKDEKPIFYGSEKEARKFFNELGNSESGSVRLSPKRR